MQVQSVQDPVYLAALERRFAAASRHSRFVRFLRVAVPGALAAAVLAIVGVSVFNPYRMIADLPIKMDDVTVSGTKITMASPNMTGFTADRRPYVLTANKALQDVTNPNFVELEILNAKVEMQDGSTVVMDAKRGFYKSREQLLDLKDDVILKSPVYEVQLIEATVDMGKGTVVSDKPVVVIMSEGVLNANRMDIAERGDLMNFHGGVTMTLKAVQRSTANSPAAGR